MEYVILGIVGLFVLAIGLPFLALAAWIILELLGWALMLVFGWPVWFWCKIFGRKDP